MADQQQQQQQSKIAQEQLPIYNKATEEVQLGTGDGRQSPDRSALKTDNDDDATATTTATAAAANETTSGSESKPREHNKPPLVPADGEPTPGKRMENRDAIPTAGGKRLGEETWGQSDVVPDDPKAASSSSSSGPHGVSGEAGQPTDEVKDNTAMNTGGATGGPQKTTGGESGEQKEKFVDKIKDKLHIGSKK